MRSAKLFDEHAAALVPRPATEEDLLLVHERRYIDAVRELSVHARPEAYEWGLGPGDNPIFAGMYDAAALQAGGTIAACELVAKGERPRGYKPGGGFHHSMPGRAAGVWIFNEHARGRRGGLAC